MPAHWGTSMELVKKCHCLEVSAWRMAPFSPDAIANETKIMFHYREDGSPFWNCIYENKKVCVHRVAGRGRGPHTTLACYGLRIPPRVACATPCDVVRCFSRPDQPWLWGRAYDQVKTNESHIPQILNLQLHKVEGDGSEAPRAPFKEKAMNTCCCWDMWDQSHPGSVISEAPTLSLSIWFREMTQSPCKEPCLSDPRLEWHTI